VLGPRVRAIAVSVAGTVSGDRLLEAATFHWRDVDLRGIVPRGLAGLPFVAGNDATVSGVAEARRGAAVGASVVLYLSAEVGIGGVLVVDGRPLVGARGESGEFGHMPFGDPALRCPCGARGCWDLEVDGRALARALGRRPPADPRLFAEQVLAAALDGGRAEADAVATVAAALGRGTGALVNALDPDLVVYGGLAPRISDAGGAAFTAALRAGLMRHRRDDPPPIVPAATGGDAPLVGAAELGFDHVLTPAIVSEPVRPRS
jgi:predicted NBD/HSP70 family sugar kinase